MNNSYRLLGDRIVIEPLPFEELPTSNSGLITPQFDKFETPSGQIRSKVSTPSYIAKGTVVQISPNAAALLEKEGSSLSVGDIVLIHPSALSHSFEFSYQRDSASLTTAKRYACVPHTLIEAIQISSSSNNTTNNG